MNITYFVAVDIGCIECGEDTNVLGVYTNEEKAKEVVKEHQERQQADWRGEHSFEIFEIEQIDKINRVEYKRTYGNEEEE